MTYTRKPAEPDRRIRAAVQWAFLALNVWVGAVFFLWVRGHETGTPAVARPAGVEGWLPIAGVMNLRAWVETGEIPHIHPAAAILAAVFLAASLLFRKAFCGWLCPIGTLSERLWKFGRRVFRRNFFPPRWLDVALRAPKYLVLAFFLWAIIPMDAQSVASFMGSPYGMAADVRMLGFFRYLTPLAATIIGVFAIGSIFVPNFWCKYFCPYGALMGLASLGSPLRIRRSPDLCIDCAKCAKACPSHLPVDRLIQIRSAECVGCLDCVDVCPAQGALEMRAPGGRRIRAAQIAAALAILFFGAYAAARIGGHWDSPIPESHYRLLIQNADALGHP